MYEDEVAIIVGALILIVLFLLVQVFYLLTLYRTLLAIRPEFRKVPPGQAWLGFIPIFHLIWPFIINKKVADSIKADLEDRGLDEGGDYGKQLGSIYPSLRIAGNIPAIGILFTLGYLVVFIIWWSRLSQSRYKLLSAGNSGGYSAELLDN
jgi:hypothetical protein